MRFHWELIAAFCTNVSALWLTSPWWENQWNNLKLISQTTFSQIHFRKSQDFLKLLIALDENYKQCIFAKKLIQPPCVFLGWNERNTQWNFIWWIKGTMPNENILKSVSTYFSVYDFGWFVNHWTCGMRVNMACTLIQNWS